MGAQRNVKKYKEMTKYMSWTWGGGTWRKWNQRFYQNLGLLDQKKVKNFKKGEGE